MKYLSKILIVLFALIIPFISQAYVSVKGYYRSNGTYVAPHVRSNPNGLKYDNYGYKPSQGLYNSSYGTKGAAWDTPTYITDPDYYTGKALYENASSGTNSYSSLYTSPYISTILPSRSISYTTKNWADMNPYSTCSQSTFLRAKEKAECDVYRAQKNNYTWTTTTYEFDGKHYTYNPKTQIMSSCPDNYSFSYNTQTGEATSCNPDPISTQLPLGCLSSLGYSATTGVSCTTGNTCAAGLVWNGNACTK
jgi:hypothetical protein